MISDDWVWDDWQEEFLNTKGDKILCCGRQVGKSEICGADAGEYAINNPKSKPIMMIAPTERQAYELFDKTLQYLLKKYPKKVVTRGQKRPTKTKIELTSGVKIYCLPVGASGTGIRGFTIGRLYVDEASRMPEDVWSAVYPALLTTGGSTILLSTPFGCEGEFYRTWINKEDAYDSFKRFSVTSEVVMRERGFTAMWTENVRERALQFIERKKKTLSNRAFAQEFLGEFVQGLFRWFADEWIKRVCIGSPSEAYNEYEQYFMGCDIARMGEDDGSFEIGYLRTDGTVVQTMNIVTRKKLTWETEDRIKSLNNVYNFKKIFIDAGAGTLGVSVFDHLTREGAVKKKIIAINNAKRIIDPSTNATTKLLKEDLYDNLRALGERGKLILLDDDDVIESLRGIQYEYVMKDDQPTRLRIFGHKGSGGDHIVEGLIRMAWCKQYKNINMAIHSF